MLQFYPYKNCRIKLTAVYKKEAVSKWRALKKSPFILGKKKGVESAFSTPFFVS